MTDVTKIFHRLIFPLIRKKRKLKVNSPKFGEIQKIRSNFDRGFEFSSDPRDKKYKCPKSFETLSDILAKVHKQSNVFDL